MNDWIRLDVSGTFFKTTRATLTSDPECVLAMMFEQPPRLQPPPVSEDGCYLIDSCPRGFAVVLNWLRYKCLVLGRDLDAKDVIPVAQFYELPALVAELMKRIDNDDDEKKQILDLVGIGILAIVRTLLTST